MPTIPQIAHQVDIAAPSSNYITITYTDATTESVDLLTSYSPFYIQGDGANEDLLDAVKDPLGRSEYHGRIGDAAQRLQRVYLAISAAKTVSTLTLVQDDFKPYHLGFEVNTTATVISGFATVAGNETKLASFRPPRRGAHQPRTLEGSGRGETSWCLKVLMMALVLMTYTQDTVSAPTESPRVFGVLMRSTLASDADHVANVSDLTSGDTNAALDSWLLSLHSLLGGVRPTLRWTPDTSTRGTYRSVRINTASLYASIEGWIVETNDAPLFHDLEFELSEV